MLQRGIGYSLTFEDGDYDHWSEYDRSVFFHLVKEAYDKFREIRSDGKTGFEKTVSRTRYQIRSEA